MNKSTIQVTMVGGPAAGRVVELPYGQSFFLFDPVVSQVVPFDINNPLRRPEIVRYQIHLWLSKPKPGSTERIEHYVGQCDDYADSLADLLTAYIERQEAIRAAEKKGVIIGLQMAVQKIQLVDKNAKWAMECIQRDIQRLEKEK